MIYLLDTNACIHHLRHPNSPVTRKLNNLDLTTVAVSAVTKAEMFYGSMRSSNPTQSLRTQQEFLSLFVSLPFDDQAAVVCGRIRAQLAKTPIGSFDSLIAAITLSNNLILVTHNTGEFSRVEGLSLEDWQLETP
jgi:tRNA(fMet)-specific endonuclease VapC